MKYTIKDIAEEAGVSVMTVSNVINKNYDKVSKSTIDLIEKIIVEKNYSPNMNARSLVNSSSKLIGLLYFTSENTFEFDDPFVSEILSSIVNEAKKSGFFILTHNIHSAEDIISIQRNWNFDGFIIVSVLSDNFREINQALLGPGVYIDTYLNSSDYRKVKDENNRIFINSDDYEAGKKTTKFLIENNHSKIAFLSYEFEQNKTSVIQQRYKAYTDAMYENNLDVNNNLLFKDDEFNKVLYRINDFSAIVVSGDYLAAKLIKFFKNNNISKKKMPSIIGFDDTHFANLIEPPLTTINLNHDSKGVVAFNTLLKLLKNEKIEEQFIKIPSELIIRNSVKYIN